MQTSSAEHLPLQHSKELDASGWTFLLVVAGGSPWEVPGLLASWRMLGIEFICKKGWELLNLHISLIPVLSAFLPAFISTSNSFL